MIEIFDTIISRDLIERYFACDIKHCRGACCIEGDAGAPITEEEYNILRQILPAVWNDLSPQARRVINTQGVGYIDREGDIVTSTVDDKDCVFTYYNNNICGCAIEKAYNEGRITFRKPVSCHLYPVRVKQYKTWKAVNYDCQKVCKAAEILGRQQQTRLYQFLREPLIRKFGVKWYDALNACADHVARTCKPLQRF
ncbi:MAG: DUF3109 family protein [Tannerella sp.]|jgi:hypothetical protein|nr:DUF3109 family protein [Tannerella sp.]